MTDTSKAPDLTHSHRPGSARAALSYRGFRFIFFGTVLSNVGTWMQNFTLPAYLDDRTGSAALVGLLVFAQLGPLLFLSIPAGVLADRVNRTRLVVTMQIVMMVGSLVLAALVASDAPIWTLFAASLAIGVANVINAPAFVASLPMLVDRRDLSGAISLNSAMINGSRIMGPVLAALLSALGLSIAALFVVNAATYVFLIVPLVVVTLPSPLNSLPERGWRKLASGVNVARGRLVVFRCLVAMFLFSLVCLPHVGLFPSVARLNFDIDPVGPSYKLLYVVWGFGAFAGALSVGTWLSSIDKRRIAPAGFLAFAASLAVFAVLSDVVIALPVAAALGFSYFMTATTLATILQQNLADGERAATMPLWFMAFGGTVPIGNLIAGPIMDAVGARWVLGAGALFAVVLARYSMMERLPQSAFLSVEDGGEPFTPVNPSRLH